MNNSGKYKCPACSVVAEINFEERKMTLLLPPGAQTFPVIGHVCGLAKSIDEINLNTLEKVE